MALCTVRFLACSRSEGEEEVEEEGPVAVSPKDFVDNEEVGGFWGLHLQ